MIPEDIKQKIEKYVKLYSLQPDDIKELSNIVEYGYSLSQQALEKKEKEIAELKAWKESAISVMPPMQEIAKALGVRLGESIHDKILPGIERLKGLIEEMQNEVTGEDVCDVEGCDFPVVSQGIYWNNTGYWCVCSKHSRYGREVNLQPKMKQEAIQREASRDEKGYLQ